jgi:hypothetical protein
MGGGAKGDDGGGAVVVAAPPETIATSGMALRMRRVEAVVTILFTTQ